MDDEKNLLELSKEEWEKFISRYIGSTDIDFDFGRNYVLELMNKGWSEYDAERIAYRDNLPVYSILKYNKLPKPTLAPKLALNPLSKKRKFPDNYPFNLFSNLSVNEDVRDTGEYYWRVYDLDNPLSTLSLSNYPTPEIDIPLFLLREFNIPNTPISRTESELYYPNISSSLVTYSATSTTLPIDQRTNKTTKLDDLLKRVNSQKSYTGDKPLVDFSKIKAPQEKILQVEQPNISLETLPVLLSSVNTNTLSDIQSSPIILEPVQTEIPDFNNRPLNSNPPISRSETEQYYPKPVEYNGPSIDLMFAKSRKKYPILSNELQRMLYPLDATDDELLLEEQVELDKIELPGTPGEEAYEGETYDKFESNYKDIDPKALDHPLTLDSNGNTVSQLDSITGSSAFNRLVSLGGAKVKGLTSKGGFINGFLNTTFGKDADMWAAGLDLGNSILTGFVGDKMYGGPKGNITKAIDLGWDAVSSAAMSFGPWGLLVGLGMKATSFLNKGVNLALGNKALDNMTATDAALNNPLTGWNVGLINALGGNTTRSFTRDLAAEENVGGSYGGTLALSQDAESKANKRYGLLSKGAFNEATDLINEAERLLNIMSDISDTAMDRFALKNSMADINLNRYRNKLSGRYNLSAIRVGKEGMPLEAPILKELELPKINCIKELKIGGTINELEFSTTIREILFSDINKLQDGGIIEENNKSTTEQPSELKEYVPENPEAIIKYVNSHKKVNFIQRLKDSFRDVILDWENEGYVCTHKMSWCEDRGKIKVFPFVLEIDGKLYDFTNPEYKHEKWDALENAEKNNDVIIFDNEKDAEWFTKHYKEYYTTFDKYAKGGKFNVIPEGALHARLHHMENDENITKKGIPVVVEKENGELEQQAEIERDEIILRLEVTLKLEDMLKEYNKASDKDKDLIAIEAGKLITHEILNNTVDNTGLINKI